MKVDSSTDGNGNCRWLSAARVSALCRVVLALLLAFCVMFVALDGAATANAAEVSAVPQSSDGETGSGQIGDGQIGDGQGGDGETGSGQDGDGETGSGQGGDGETGSGQGGDGETGSGQGGDGETGIGQGGDGETGSGQGGDGETGSGQGGDGETGSGQGGDGETGIGQGGDGETGSGQGGDGETGSDQTIAANSLGDGGSVMRLTSQNGSTDDAPIGQDDTVEAYAIPAGSAYIYEIGQDIQYVNDAENNAITNAVAGALTYIKGLYTDDSGSQTPQIKEATIVVSDGIYQGSVDVSNSGGGTSLIAQLIAEIFEMNEVDPSELRLNIVAQDAFTEEEDGKLTFHSDGAGGAQVEGNINVSMGGIHVLLAGLFMSTQGEVTIDGAKSLTYYGTAQDDVLNIVVSNFSGNMEVDSGDGDDRVTIRATKKQNFRFGIGIDPNHQGAFEGINPDEPFGSQLPDALKTILQDLMDKITNLDLAANDTHLQMGIHLGKGNDILDFTLVDSTDLKLGMLTGDEVIGDGTSTLTYGFGIDTGAADVIVNGQEGNDSITISGARSFTMGQNIVQFLADRVAGQTDFQETTFTIDGGAGDDVITVNTTAPFSTIGGIATNIAGSDGFDRLHITGKLNKNVEEADRIAAKVLVDATEIIIQALAEMTFLGTIAGEVLTLAFEKQFSILSNGIDAFTDELENKRTVQLTGDAHTGQALSYTDYIYTDYQAEDEVAHVNFTSRLTIPESGLLFTNIVIAPEDYDTVQIDHLSAEGLNVLVASKHIRVEGDITGKNILLYSIGSDEPVYNADVAIVEDDLGEDMGMDFSLYEAATSNTITIGANAKVTAAQAVDILASLLMEKGYLPEFDQIPLEFQPFVYKNGTAKVTILGAVTAGGFLRAGSELNVTIDTANKLIKVIPFAVAALKGESTVTVGGNAVLTSGSATQLGAYANALLLADAMGGATKCSFGVVVAVLDTHVAVQGNASVTAQEDVDITANTAVIAKAYATGKKAVDISVKPKSGMFVAVMVVQNNTTAQIRENASVTALAGNVRVASTSRVRTDAVSIAIPSNEGEETRYTSKETKQFVAKLLGFEYGGFTGAISGVITGNNGIMSALEGAIKPLDGKPSSQFLGSLVVGYIANTNTARIDTTGTVTAAGDLLVLAKGVTFAQQRADASLYKTPPIFDLGFGNFSAEDDPSKAIGAAVGVTIFKHQNLAQILGGNITAAEFVVDANMGYTGSETIVKAGHVPAKENTTFGLAGAISVQVASAENEARIGRNGIYAVSEGGSVLVESTGTGRYTTVADASGKRSRRSFTIGFITIPFEPAYQSAKNSTGVGAGVAVGLVGVDVLAIVEDGVNFGPNSLRDLKVNASYDGTEYLEAAAGASGGTSIVPVFAVAVGGVNTQAYVGSGEQVTATGDVTVKTASQVERTVQVDAKAVGSGVSVGGAFGITVVNDSANAALERSVTVGNVTVDAISVSRMAQEVLASSKGAKPPAQSGQNYGSSGTQSEYDSVVGGGTTGSATDNTTYKAGQPDQMMNKGLLGILTMAGILGSRNVNTQTMEQVTANPPKAQTSEGSIQVAASLALNIHKNTASARIGDGVRIQADGDVLVSSRIDTDSVIRANSSAVSSNTAVGVGVALNKLTYTNTAYVGAKYLKANSLTIRADILEAEEKRTVEEIFADLLTYLGDTEGSGMLLEALYSAKGYENLEDMLTKDEAFREQYEALPEEDPEALEALIIDMLTAQFKGEPMDTAGEILEEFAQAVVQNFVKQFKDPQFLLSILTGGLQSKMDELLNKYAQTADISIQRIYDLLTAHLSTKFGNPGELDGVGNLISTSAISGLGAANVGVAGSAAIALVDAETSAILAGADTLPSTEDILVKETITIYSQGAQKAYTTASAAADLNGLPEKNKDGTGNTEGKSVGVGASVAVTELDAASEAKLGSNRNVQAKGLSVVSEIRNDIDTISVAGSDPMARRDQIVTEVPALGDPADNTGIATGEKDIAVDASVALSMVDNLVHAIVDTGTKLILNGGNLIQTDEALSESVMETVNLWIRAYQRGQTYSTASGFAVGEGKAAVGAAVGVNMANSDVQAAFSGDGSAKGKAKVEAVTSNEDEAAGLATVVGASLDRYLGKMREVFNTLSFGESAPTLNNTIMNKINGYANPAMTKLGNAAQGMPVLPMLLQALNIYLPTSPTTGNSSVSGAVSEAGQHASGAAGQELDETAKQEQSFNIAAAAGANITEHITKALITGTLKAESVEVSAENLANFRTLGTGAAVVPQENSNNVAMGVAVSINGNRANASLGGDVTAQGTGDNNGDVLVRAILTQNMDGKYRGLLGAQALAGSVSGSGGKLGFAGAVSILKAVAKAVAQIDSGAVINGGDIIVQALDKSKLAVRAGGVSAGGTSVGMGASFALIYAENTLQALVGNNAQITADSLAVNAQKLSVDSSDYDFPLSTKDLFTVDVTEDSKKGLINIQLANAKKGIVGIDIALGTDDLLKIADMLNYLASVNYYAEAIAGSISGGDDVKAALAGSVAMLFAKSVTQAWIGSDAEIILDQDAEVTASSKTNGRMIGGSLAVTTASTGVGVNIAAVDDRDQISALVDTQTQIAVDGDVLVKASAHRNLLNVTVAASVATNSSDGEGTDGSTGGTGTTAGKSGGASLGGSINVIFTGSDVRAFVAESAVVAAKGAVTVQADNLSDVTLISTSVAGSGGGTAAGGTMALIVTENNTLAEVGRNVKITAGQIRLNADSEEKLLNVLASLSAAVSSGSDEPSSTSVAATLGVTLTKSTTIAQALDYAELTATNGPVSILANGDVKQYLVLAAATAAAGTNAKAAAGATVNVNIFRHTVKALTGRNAVLIATGSGEGCDVILSATGNSQVIIVTIAGSASTGNLALSGAIPVVITDSDISAAVGEESRLEADDSIYVNADLTTGLYNIAGGLAGAKGSAVGATISTGVLSSRVTATIGNNARLIAHGKYAHTTNRKERRGVTVRANADNTILMASVSGGASGKVTVVGVVNTLVLKNTVKALVGEYVTISAGYDNDGNAVPDGDGDVSVDADDDSHLYNLAGSIGVGGNAGAGATVVVMVYDKTVAASVGANSLISARGDVFVTANSNDDVYLVAVGFAASGSVGVAGNVGTLVFQNKTHAYLDGSVVAARNVSVIAKANSELLNIAGGMAASGNTAVTAVAVVTYFQNETIARLGSGAAIGSEDAPISGDLNVEAISKEFVTADALGISGSGNASVGGTLDVIVTRIVTKAYTGENVKVYAHGDISIKAEDDYDLVAAAMTVSASGGAGIGVTALVSVGFNTISAVVGENNRLSGKNVQVLAAANRDVVAVTSTVAAAGGAGVGVSIAVVVNGNKMSQDAHDAIYQTGKTDENGNRASLDPQTQVSGSFAAAHPQAQGYMPRESLDDLLAGDGQHHGKENYNKYGQSDNADYADGQGPQADQFDDVTEMQAQSAPIKGLSDAVSAIISTGAQIQAEADVSVIAKDAVSAIMITGGVSAGGTGVGIGLSAATFFSNVQALVNDGATLNAGGKINILANAGALSNEAAFRKEEDLGISQTLTGQGIDLGGNPALRLISFNVAAGSVGVGVSAATLLVFSEARAILAGDVTGAANLTVQANMDMGNPLTVVTGLTAGAVGVNVAAGITYFSGKVESGIYGDAQITGVTAVTVRSTGVTNATTAAATLAAGATAVNAGVALAFNQTQVRTYIGQGVSVTAANVQVSTDFDATAKVFNIALSGGTVAVNGSVAIAVNLLDAVTYIGTEPGTSSSADCGNVSANSVTVKSNISSGTQVTGVSVAGGAVVVNGMVALGFNRASGIAAVKQMNITADTLTVTALSDGDVRVDASSVMGGGVAVGATVAVGQLKTVNKALVDTDNAKLDLSGAIRIYAGTQENPYNSEAIVTVITGAVGAVAGALNFAVALNESENIAEMSGSGTVQAGSLNAEAWGNTHAYALIANGGGGAVTANVSVAYADISSVQKAVAGSENLTLTGALNVISRQNTTFLSGDLTLEQVGVEVNKTDMAQAWIFSASAGMVSASANTAIARAGATGIAQASPDNGSIDGSVTVDNQASAKASAIIDNLNLGFASVGVMVGYAYAAGDFGAILEVDGELTIGGDVNVTNNTASVADSTTNPAMGGVNASVVSNKVNVGYAEVTTTSQAKILGSGSITAKNFSVTDTSMVTANARVKGCSFQGSGISVVSNAVTAKLSAKQEAGVEGVRLTGDSLRVLAVYNVDEESLNSQIPARADDTGAMATVGACYGEVSVYGAAANVATAQSDSKVSAFMKAAGANMTGAIDVITLATSYANAGVEIPTVSASLANVAVAVLTADAAGTYKAYLETAAGKTITGTEIRVYVRHNTDAQASIGPLGGAAVEIGGVSVKTNLAKVNAKAKTQAYITGNGDLTTTAGNLLVFVHGRSRAEGALAGNDASLTIANFAANAVEATVSTTQKAYMTVDGTVTVAGELKVLADYTESTSGALATSGLTKSGSKVSVSLVSGSVISAKARSSLVNSAFISGQGVIHVGKNVTVQAEAATKALAEVKQGTNVTLASGNAMFASAQTADRILANLEGVTLVSGGDVTVLASGKTQSDAKSMTGVSVILISGDGGNAEALIGGPGNGNQQTVTASIGRNAKVTAVGNILVKAENIGAATAAMTSGYSVSGASVSSQIVPTESFYQTTALIGDDAQITSTGGSVTILAWDQADANTRVDGDSFGVVANMGSKYAKNEVTQTVLTGISNGAAIWAHGNVRICGASVAKLQAVTVSENTSIFASGGWLQAYNTLNRDVDVTVGDNVSIFSDFGAIEITSRSGELDSSNQDKILTKAEATSGSAVAVANAKAITKYDATSDVTIGGGGDITNTFGSILIAAYASSGSIQTVADLGAYGLGSDGTSQGELVDSGRLDETYANLSANVTLAKEKASLTEITGKDISIMAKLRNLHIYNYTNTRVGGFMNFGYAYSDIHFMLNLGVQADKVHLRAYDSLQIKADASPDNTQENHLHAKALTKITAFAGRVESHARIYGEADAAVQILANAVLTGADIRIDLAKFNGNVVLHAEGTRRAIASERENKVNRFLATGGTQVNESAVFHIGDAAAGIAIDVYKQDGTVRIRSVGTQGGFTPTITPDQIRFPTIANIAPGRLSVFGLNEALQSAIYGQQYIPELVITNRTDLDLVFDSIDLYNESFTHGTVNAMSTSGNVYNAQWINVSENTAPAIYVYSRDRGDVIFKGLVNNERGSLHIEWTEKNRPDSWDPDASFNGSLYTNPVLVGSVEIAPVWAHTLTVIHAANIGYGEDARFQIYLTVHETQDPVIHAQATGNVWLELTLTEIKPVPNLSGDLSDQALSGTLELKHVVAGGDLDILLPVAMRMAYLADAQTAQIVIPGVIQFTTETLDLGETTIRASDLERYIIGGGSGEYEVYTLPNGMQMYLDAATKKVYRMITPDGHSLDTSMYSFNGTVITFHEYGDATLDIANGTFTAGEDGFDLTIWEDKLKGWYTVSGKVVVQEHAAIYNKTSDGNYETTEINSLTIWRQSNGYTYYFLDQASSTNLNNTGYANYFVLVLDEKQYLRGVYSGGRSDTKLEDTNPAGTQSDSNYTYTKTVTVDGMEITVTVTQKVTVQEDKTTYGTPSVTIAYGGNSIQNAGKGTTLSGWLSGTVIKELDLTTAEDGNILTKVNLVFSSISLQAKASQEVTITVPDESGSGESKEETVQAYVFGNIYVFPNTVYLYQEAGKEAIELQAYTNQPVTFEKIQNSSSFMELLRIYLSTQAILRLDEGVSVVLEEFMPVGDDIEDLVYLLNDSLMVTRTGTVIRKPADGVRFWYNGSEVLAESEGTSARYDSAGSVILNGKQYLARLNGSVAIGTDGIYYFLENGVWVEADSQTQNGVTTIRYKNVVHMTIHSQDGITYHTEYENGKAKVRVGSDASVFWFDTPSETVKFRSISGTGYEISYLEGANVKLKMEDDEGSLLDGDRLNNNPDNADIVATEGDITIWARSAGSIGTKLDPLDMFAHGRVNILDQDGGKIIATDSYVYVPAGEDDSQADYTLDPYTVIDGAEFVLVTQNGSIIGYDLLLTNGGSFVAMTNRNEVRDGSGNVTGFDPNLNADSEGNIFFHNIRAENSSSLAFDAAGSILVEEDLDWYQDAPNRQNWITPIGLESQSSEITLAAGKDITISNGLASKDSTHAYIAKGTILVDNTGAVDSQLTWTAGGDILIDSIIAKGSEIALSAAGTITKWSGIQCGEYGSRAFIKYADTDTHSNSKLSLSAGSLGVPQSWFLVDVPKTVTVELPKVGDVYLDSLELILQMDTGDLDEYGQTVYQTLPVGSDPILTVDHVTHPDNPKIDEFLGKIFDELGASVYDGDFLLALEKVLQNASLDMENPEELAAWIMERADRDSWVSQLNREAILEILGKDEKEGISAAFLAGLLGSDDLYPLLSHENQDKLLQSGKQLNGSQISKRTDPAEIGRELTDENLLQIFENLTDEQKAHCGLDVSAVTITGEQVAQLLEDGKMTYGQIKAYLPAAFLARLSLRDADTAAAMVKTLLPEDGEDLYEGIFGANGTVARKDSGATVDEQEKAPASGGYAMAYETAHQALTKLLTHLNKDGLCFVDMGKYLGSLLTDKDIQQLYDQAMEQVQRPEGQTKDPVSKSLNVHIGTSTGKTNLYNDGDITVVQDNGDLTVDTIISQRGSVTVRVLNQDGMDGSGNVVAYYPQDSLTHDGPHIHGTDITIAAYGSVGSEDRLLKLEQRTDDPLVVTSVYEDMYRDEDYITDLGAMRPGDKLDDTAFRPTLPQVQYVLRQDEKGNWYLDVAVRHDLIREDYSDPNPPATLTVTASNGGAYIQELTGSVSGSITADGDARYDVLDGQVGTYEKPVVTQVGGTLTVNAKGDINISEIGDLVLVANSESGQVNARAKANGTQNGSLKLSNSNGKDLLIGVIHGDADVSVHAQASLIPGDRHGKEASIIGRSIAVEAGGTAGTEAVPLLIDTDAVQGGSLTVKAESAWIREITGDLKLDTVTTQGDLHLTASGSILETGTAGDAYQDALEALEQAAKAEAEAKGDLADKTTQAALTQQALDQALDEEEARQAVVDALTKELAETADDDEKQALQEALDLAAEALKKAQEQKAAAERKNTAAQTAKADAETAWDNAVKDREDAQLALNTISVPTTVDTAGDLYLEAGNAVGDPEHPLTVKVGGGVTAEAPNGVFIAGQGNVRFDKVQTVGDAWIGATGDLTGGSIRADSVALVSGGSIGNEKAPLKLNVNSLSGQAAEDFFVYNGKNLEVGGIYAGDKLVLTVEGKVTGASSDPDHVPDMAAQDIIIHAGGNIGSAERPLETVTDGFHGTADEIYICNHSDDLELSDTVSGTLSVETSGNVSGSGNTAHHITVHAGGNVGALEEPFYFWAGGTVNITADYEILNYRNLYRGKLSAQSGIGLHCQQIFVLKLDVTVGGQEKALYLLLTVDSEGNLILLAMVLGERETDAAFWQQVMRMLRGKLGISKVEQFVAGDYRGFGEAVQAEYPSSSLETLDQMDPGTKEQLDDVLETLDNVLERLPRDCTEEELLESCAEELEDRLGETFRRVPFEDGIWAVLRC